MFKKYLPVFCFTIIVTLSCLIHFWGINWGTPNWGKSLQVFGNSEKIAKFAPAMFALREKYYAKGIAFLDWKGKLTPEYFGEYYARHKHKPFDELSQETVLDFSRGYLLGVVNSDEQVVIATLSRINLKNFYLGPELSYPHGGFYFYSLGASFLVGKIIGFIKVSSDASYYLFHPEDIERMYTLARAYSAFFAVACIILVYFIVKPFWGNIPAFLSMFLLCFNPFFLNYGHQVKAHTSGIFWALLGLYFCSKVIITSEKKYYLLAGISLGISTSCLPTNGIFILSIPLTELLMEKYAIKKLNWKYVLLSLGLALFAYLITTPYVFFRFKRFYNSAIVLNYVVYDYGRFNIRDTLKFLEKIFTFGHFWITLPIMIIGIVFTLREKKIFSRLLFIIFILFFIFAIIFKHQGVFAAIGPHLSIYTAVGSYYLFRHLKRFWKVLGIAYFVVMMSFTTMGIILYEKLFVQKGNLTIAGEWINQNIPSGTLVGIHGGWAAPGNFPAIKFLKYKLINFSWNEKDISWEENKLPEYLILTGFYTGRLPRFVQSLEFKNYYQEVKKWDAPKKILGIKFENNLIPTENIDVEIFQLKKKVHLDETISNAIKTKNRYRDAGI